MKNQVNSPADSDVSVNDYFDSKAIYCLISLLTFTNNRELSQSATPQSSKSRKVMRETRARCYLFKFENRCPLTDTIYEYTCYCISIHTTNLRQILYF